MADPETSGDGNASMATAELARRMEDILATLGRQAEERHQANNRLHKTLFALADKGNEQDRRVEMIEGTLRTLTEKVTAVAQSTDRIEQTLTGDTRWAEKGLLAKHDALDGRVTVLEVEQRKYAAKLDGEIETVKRGWKLLSIVGGAIAAVLLFAKTLIGWIKGTP